MSSDLVAQAFKKRGTACDFFGPHKKIHGYNLEWYVSNSGESIGMESLADPRGSTFLDGLFITPMAGIVIDLNRRSTARLGNEDYFMSADHMPQIEQFIAFLQEIGDKSLFAYTTSSEKDFPGSTTTFSTKQPTPELYIPTYNLPIHFVN